MSTNGPRSRGDESVLTEEARQRADALAVQMESALRALARRVPEDVRARAEALVVDTEKALATGASRDRLRLLASRLEEVRRVLDASAGAAGTELWGGRRPKES